MTQFTAKHDSRLRANNDELDDLITQTRFAIALGMGLFSRQATRSPTGKARALAIGVCAVLVGCAREVERPGQLIVALDTDMALPQQIDTIHVQVELNGKIEFKNEYPVWPAGDAGCPRPRSSSTTGTRRIP